MALIKCNECGSEISDKATSCPRCGFPLQRIATEGNASASTDPKADFAVKVKEKIAKSGKSAAIKMYVELTGYTLGEAEAYVDKIDRELRFGAKLEDQQRNSVIWVAGGIFLLVAILGGIYAINAVNNSPRTPSIVNGSEQPPSQLDQPILDVSWSEVDSIYSIKSKYTDLQKDDFWKRYKGKKVKWKGVVSSVSEDSGLILQVKMNPETFTSDLLIRLKDLEKPKALTLRKGDQVSFVGVLDKWGSHMPIMMKEGEILF